VAIALSCSCAEPLGCLREVEAEEERGDDAMASLPLQ